MIVVVDYGMGNIGSIVNMMRKLGVPCITTNEINLIRNAHAIILPGVGSFDNGMLQLKEKNLINVLEEVVLSKGIPFLGICLGMQLLLDKSEEGYLPGLGWIPGEVTRFNFKEGNEKLRVPHMGWNSIIKKTEINLGHDKNNEEIRYYFVHSYHVNCSDTYVLATTNYGYEFPSFIRKQNIWGAQFHPEKSHRFGVDFFRYFLRETMCLEQE